MESFFSNPTNVIIEDKDYCLDDDFDLFQLPEIEELEWNVLKEDFKLSNEDK